MPSLSSEKVKKEEKKQINLSDGNFMETMSFPTVNLEAEWLWNLIFCSESYIEEKMVNDAFSIG